MPKRSKADSQATAEAILATATRLFVERGYAVVSLEDVATAAGVTRGAVYHHFASKLGLFERVLDRVQANVGERVAAAADSFDEPWARFEAGCRAFLVAVTTDPVRRIMLIDAPAVLNWDTWRGQDGAHSGRHLDEMLVELEQARLVHLPSRAAATALLSGAMNEAALWVADQDDSSAALDQAWQMLRRLLVSIRSTGATR